MRRAMSLRGTAAQLAAWGRQSGQHATEDGLETPPPYRAGGSSCSEVHERLSAFLKGKRVSFGGAHFREVLVMTNSEIKTAETADAIERGTDKMIREDFERIGMEPSEKLVNDLMKTRMARLLAYITSPNKQSRETAKYMIREARKAGAKEESETCQWCGNQSSIDPSDQTQPADYCHDDDH